jgi:hypothetical protein
MMFATVAPLIAQARDVRRGIGSRASRRLDFILSIDDLGRNPLQFVANQIEVPSLEVDARLLVRAFDDFCRGSTP